MIKNRYSQKINSLNAKLNEKKKVLKQIVFLRLVSFVLFIAVIWSTVYFKNFFHLFFLLVPIIFFAALLKRNLKIKFKVAILKNLITINQNELKVIDGDYSMFNNGEKYAISSHDYAHDIDLFGGNSIYQFLNRTTSTASEIKLAQYLNNFETDASKIKARQEAIEELKDKLGWRQDFSAHGKYHAIETNQLYHIINWAKKGISIFNNESLWKVILWGVPALMILLSILSGMGYISGVLFLLLLSIPMTLVGKKLKNISYHHGASSKFLTTFKQYDVLASFIEKETFNSAVLSNLKEKLHADNKIASIEINKLASIVEALDNRSNPVFAFLTNAFFIWDLQYTFKLKKWINTNANHIEGWFNTIHEFDVFNSFANYAYNNPNYALPQLSNEVIINTTNTGHPLISTDVNVLNSFGINSLHNFVIITGANMAGKSTFLRTVATNLVLAMCGMRVCADSFTFKPTKLVTSMRAEDSLSDNESYFYSELKRLKMIVDKLKADEELFVILDEILKGTNSKDKAEGSKKFVSQLINFKVAGIIATHDLSLCSVADEYPDKVKNKYFDVEIIDDKLDFDYKLKEGICSNMNAAFLMNKMGITTN
jgi:hypothetical protein